MRLLFLKLNYGTAQTPVTVETKRSQVGKAARYALVYWRRIVSNLNAKRPDWFGMPNEHWNILVGIINERCAAATLVDESDLSTNSEFILDALREDLLVHGFQADWTPNERGLLVEELISFFSSLHYGE
jgi:hypothetical protein